LDRRAGATDHEAVFNNALAHSAGPHATMSTPARHSAPALPIRRDTRAWRTQVWISFGAAATLCAIGLLWLPGEDLDRAFMVMGYVFCLSTAFALSKYIRDNEQRRVDTPMWGSVVWTGFAFAMALTAWGLWRMDVNPTYKAYLGVSWLFLISTVFTLAKTLRDAHEADVMEARLQGLAAREDDDTVLQHERTT
jgi:hypothetical protein